MKNSLLSLLLLGIATPSFAVPIPWKNCGQASDHVQVTQMDATFWPPTLNDQPLPLEAVANLDPETGELIRLRAAWLGAGWLFELSDPPKESVLKRAS